MESEELSGELHEFKLDVFGDEWVKKYIREIVIEEIKLAEQVASEIGIEPLGLGIGDILKKVDDVVGRIWDKWKKRRG